MRAGDIFHLADPSLGVVSPLCGARLTKWVSPSPIRNRDGVNCKDCLYLMSNDSEKQPVTQEERMRDQRRQWTIEAVAGATDLGLTDWLREKLTGGSGVRPLHKPPYMNEKDDGVFVFHDAFITDNVLEVVPQTSGNVEITIEYDGEGHLFSLSHLDRADLIRALLHDFHYSPERGGPNDDQV